MAGDAHDHFVAGARFRELRDQRQVPPAASAAASAAERFEAQNPCWSFHEHSGQDWRVRYYLLMQDLNKSLPTRILSVLPLILSGLALVVSFMSFQLTAVRSVKPVLTIAYQSDAGWSLTNVGNGPALNVIVARRETEGKWFDPVRVPPLALAGCGKTALFEQNP